MNEVFLLLRPKWQTARNSFRRSADRFKAAGLLLLVLAACTGIFFAAHHLLHYIKELDVGTGPELQFAELRFQINLRLLTMVILTFLAVLLFSNIITALSTFFLSDDLRLVGALPVSPDSLFLARFVEMVVDSSWMIVIFGTPVYVAFGVVYHAGWMYYAVIPFLVLPFILIPAGLGVILTMALVSAFPARRIRDILFLLAVFAAGLLFLLLRLLQPEKLVNTDAQLEVLDFIRTLQAPVKSWMPGFWVAEILAQLSRGPLQKSGWLYFALLWTSGLGMPALALLFARAFYAEAFSKSQEASRIRISRASLVNRLIAGFSQLFPAAARQMVMKDLRVFMRDTTQWSQLFLLAALMVIYLFNVRVLPLSRFGAERLYLQNVISYLNIGLAGFVLSALAARFVFPMVSLEGKAFWIVKSSPVSLSAFLWSKFWMGALPLLLIGEVLVIVTNWLLDVDPVVRWVGMATIFGMTFAISGLGVGLGARFPRFHVENPAKVATSFGGVVYMITAMSVIGAVVALEATPTYFYFVSRLRALPLNTSQILLVLACLAAVAIILTIATLFPMRLGLRWLEKLELP